VDITYRTTQSKAGFRASARLWLFLPSPAAALRLRRIFDSRRALRAAVTPLAEPDASVRNVRLWRLHAKRISRGETQDDSHLNNRHHLQALRNSKPTNTTRPRIIRKSSVSFIWRHAEPKNRGYSFPSSCRPGISRQPICSLAGLRSGVISRSLCRRDHCSHFSQGCLAMHHCRKLILVPYGL
jgi:hypothetical protein